jgi:hypothetical protein
MAGVIENHDDVIWDCPKMGVLGEKKSFLNTFLGRVRITIGTL